MEAQRKAFVLMPFDPDFDEVWKIVEEPFKEAGYSVERADTDPTHGNVLKDIVRGIADADLVVADLTNANANVFYELGLSHGLNIPTILITQSTKEMPFDLRTYRAEAYSTSYVAAQELQKKLRDIADKRATGELEVGSPVIDFLPQGARTRRYPEGEKVEALKVFTFALSEPIAQTFDAFAVLLRRWSEPAEKFEDQRERIQAAKREGGESGLAVAGEVASETQQTLDEVADILSEIVPELQTRVAQLTESTAALSTMLEAGYSPENRNGLVRLKRGLDQAHAAGTGALEGVIGFRQEVGDVREVTPELDNAVARVIQELDRAVFIFMALQAFVLRTVGLLDDKLGPVDPSELEGGAKEIEGEPATADAEA